MDSDLSARSEAVSNLIAELGLRKFVHALAKALEEQSTPQDLTPFLSHEEWTRIPNFYLSGVSHQKVLERDSKVLLSLYDDAKSKLTIEAKREGRDQVSGEELTKCQAQFLRTVDPTMIPIRVWVHVLASELQRESSWTNGGTLSKPITTMISKIPTYASDPELGKEPSRKHQIEERFLATSTPPKQQAFVNSLTAALDSQPHSVILDLEGIVDPDHWVDLLDESKLQEQADLERILAVHPHLDLQYRAELAQFQRTFLRKHATEIPYFVLPKTLAAAAEKEETYQGGEITNLLKTMGIEY